MATEKIASRDEGGGYRIDPALQDHYRCPVSTPANNQKRQAVEYNPVSNYSTTTHDRKPVVGLTRPPVNRNMTRNMDKPMRRNVEYYFVDRNLQRKELTNTNTYWLQSLCAQPVTEILGKYRRKSDFQRTRFLWSKMFSTPGERALLQAWSDNKTPRAVTASADMARTKHHQPLSFSKDIKVSSTVSVSNSGKSECDDLRAQLASASGSHCESEIQSMARDSPTLRSEGLDDANVSRIILSDNEALPNLSGQRRKGQIILQQRKYFSGNRRHPAIPHVQRLNPVKTEDIAKSADVICLKPTQKPSTPRVMSRAGSRDRQASSAKSLNDVDETQVKFPLIVSTRGAQEGVVDTRGAQGRIVSTREAQEGVVSTREPQLQEGIVGN